MRRFALPALIVVVTCAGWAQLAYAIPGSDACTAAKSTLNTKLAAVLQLSPELLGAADTPAELTPAVLAALKANALAGEGAQGVIQAAIAAHAAVVTACAPPPTVTPTPTPTPTPTVTPTPTPPPADDDADFDQVGEVPSGAIDTGGGPA